MQCIVWLNLLLQVQLNSGWKMYLSMYVFIAKLWNVWKWFSVNSSFVVRLKVLLRLEHDEEKKQENERK